MAEAQAGPSADQLGRKGIPFKRPEAAGPQGGQRPAEVTQGRRGRAVQTQA